MDFKNYRQGPPEYPFLTEVATEYLVKPNGKPTILTYLLKDLGCTVHAGSKEHGTTPVTLDEATLAPVVKRIIEDYIQYHNHHTGGYDESSIGTAMRDDVSHFMDPSDFVPESGELKPVSINDIERFMIDVLTIRIEKGERLKNGNPKLQARINALWTELADMITAINLATAGKNCNNIADSIRQQVHDVSGFTRLSTQMSLLKREVYKKSWLKIDTKKPIQDKKILHLFTTLRALTRLRNQEAGINTGKEMKKLAEKRNREDEDRKRKVIPLITEAKQDKAA